MVRYARQVAQGHNLDSSLSLGKQTERGLAACSGSKCARRWTAQMGSHAKGDQPRRLENVS